MPPLLAALHAKGILTDDLTVPGEAGAHQKKYMGVARWEQMINKSSTWGWDWEIITCAGFLVQTLFIAV